MIDVQEKWSHKNLWPVLLDFAQLPYVRRIECARALGLECGPNWTLQDIFGAAKQNGLQPSDLMPKGGSNDYDVAADERHKQTTVRTEERQFWKRML